MRLASLFTICLPLLAQDAAPESELLTLGEKLLAQAKEQYESKQWIDCIETAERARTAFLALVELYSSQKRADGLKRPNELAGQCNQLIRLARDARKSAGEKPASPAPAEPPKPADPSVLPKDAVPAEPVKPPRFEPPAPAAQEAAEKAIREVYKADYAKSGPWDREKLARRFVQEARETKADRAAQYVLFREASELAASSGDLRTALAAIDEMEAVFDVDRLALKVALFTKLPSAATHEWAAVMLEGSMAVIQEAVKANHFDIASIVVRKAESIARNPMNVTAVAQVQARAKELAELQKEHSQIKAAERTLAGKGDDPAINLQVGRFYGFAKGEWEKALPLLRKGSDAELRKVAETELAIAAGPELQMDLADAWWALSKNEPGGVARTQLKLRARYWYQRARPGLTGFSRSRVDKLLRDLDEEERSRWAVNLFALIDPKKDAVKGEWALDEAGLVIPAGETVRLQVPYVPPEEYDLSLTVSRKGGTDGLMLGVVGGGRQFYVALDGLGGAKGGLDAIDGKPWHSNESQYAARVFTDGRPRAVLCSIRKSRVTVSVDGEKLIDWKADYRRVSLWPALTTPNRKALFLSAWNSKFQVTEMWLTPISAQGQKLR